MMTVLHEVQAAVNAGEYAHRRRAYVSVVTKNSPMWRALVDSYAPTHWQEEGETIDQYLGRIAEQDFEDGLEACHFPDLLNTLNTYSEQLAIAMLVEAGVQPVEAILAKRAQVLVVDEASFKEALELIARREQLPAYLAHQTIEVRIQPRQEPGDKSAVQVIHEALEAQGWSASVVLKSLRAGPDLPQPSDDEPQRPRG